MVERPIRFYGISDVGKKRDHNEDAFYVPDDGDFCILADGMGGRHFGEVAAGMTVDLLRQRFETFFPPSYAKLRSSDQAQVRDMVINLLDEWIREVNFMVWSKGQDDPQFREMGTTVVAAYALPNIAVLAHVGDSRAYVVHGGEMSQITKDHSLVNSQIDSGMLTAEEAAQSTQRNIITRAIGTSKDVKPEVKSCHVEPGDRILICSDGLSDMVTDEVIRDIVVEHDDPREVLSRLVAEANENGGRDNITVVMIQY